MLANYHTHTYRCKHALGEDREYVEEAIRGGLKVLGFSDHCPWIDGLLSGNRMFIGQLDDYFDSIVKLKKEYQNEITIYAGLEAEYFPELMEWQDDLLKDYPLDYMILGQHFTSLESPIYKGFPTEEVKHLKEYVDMIIEGMNTGRYQYVTHPDLINYTGSSINYELHMLRLCEYLKEKNIPVEINMLGLMDNRHYPSNQFLEIAKRVGNTAIIGIDAHQPDKLSMIMEHDRCHQLASNYSLSVVEYIPGLE